MLGCTSGLVRFGFFGPRSPNATQLAGVAQYDKVPSDGTGIRIADIDLASFGNCHNFNCFDVHHCAARRGNKTGRFAITITDDLRRSASSAAARTARGARNLRESPAMLRRLEVARTHGIDLVIVVPEDSVAEHPIVPEEQAYFDEHNIVIKKVPWIVPPNMRHELNRGCGFMDFIRLHTLNLTDYDAVVRTLDIVSHNVSEPDRTTPPFKVLYDADVMVAGDISPVLHCAAQNYFISTSGPNSPLNLGFLGFRPDERLLEAALYFAEQVEYDKPPRGSTSRRRSRGGWDYVGYADTKNYFTSCVCGADA